MRCYQKHIFNNIQTHRLARAFDDGIHVVFIARRNLSLQGPCFLLFAFRCRTRTSYNSHTAPLRSAHGFCSTRDIRSWLQYFDGHLQVLLVLGLANRAITPQFAGLAEVRKDLIRDQALLCFILQKHKMVSGQHTLVLQASQPCLHVENHRSLHGSSGQYRTTSRLPPRLVGFLLSAHFVFLGARG